MFNKTKLESSIATLQKLRDVYHNQLDASDLAELDAELQKLRILAKSSKMQSIDSSYVEIRILRIIDVIIRTVTNITDWM